MAHTETKKLASLWSSLGTRIGHRICLGCCVKSRSFPYLSGKSRGTGGEGRSSNNKKAFLGTAQ